MTVSPVNDAPVVSLAYTNTSCLEGHSIALQGFANVSDLDYTEQFGGYLTLRISTSSGAFTFDKHYRNKLDAILASNPLETPGLQPTWQSIGDLSQETFSYQQFEMDGLAATLNDALMHLHYRAPEYVGGGRTGAYRGGKVDTITVEVSDNHAGTALSHAQVLEVDVLPFNHYPWIAIAGSTSFTADAEAEAEALSRVSLGTLSAIEDGGSVTLAELSVGDVDSEFLTTTLTASNGVIRMQDAGAPIVRPDGTVIGLGTATCVLEGSPAYINAYLGSLSFLPTANYFGVATDEIEVRVNDHGNYGEGGVREVVFYVGVDVSSSDDAPTILVPATTPLAPLTVTLAGSVMVSTSTFVWVSDVDVSTVSSSVEDTVLSLYPPPSDRLLRATLTLPPNQGLLSIAAVDGMHFNTGGHAGRQNAQGMELNVQEISLYSPERRYRGFDEISFQATQANMNAALQTLAYHASNTADLSITELDPSVQCGIVSSGRFSLSKFMFGTSLLGAVWITNARFFFVFILLFIQVLVQLR